jgi:hypothetical protein
MYYYNEEGRRIKKEMGCRETGNVKKTVQQPAGCYTHPVWRLLSK